MPFDYYGLPTNPDDIHEFECDSRCADCPLIGCCPLDDLNYVLLDDYIDELRDRGGVIPDYI